MRRCAMPFLAPSPACVPLRSRCPATSTGRTISCRKRWCERSRHIDSFQPGTNLNAWLFTILRNLFHSEYRKRRREVEDADGVYAARLSTQPEQGARLDLEDFKTALARLPPDQREVLLLVGASGFSYEEAAEICQCAVGTIKSRVNRARTRLAQLLAVESVDDLGPDDQTRAALQATG